MSVFRPERNPDRDEATTIGSGGGTVNDEWAAAIKDAHEAGKGLGNAGGDLGIKPVGEPVEVDPPAGATDVKSDETE